MDLSQSIDSSITNELILALSVGILTQLKHLNLFLVFKRVR